MPFKQFGMALVSASLAAPLLMSCAGVRYGTVPVKLAKKDGSNQAAVDKVNFDADRKMSPNGIRYYDTSLYLLIYPDGLEKVSWKLLELPDQSKLRVAKPFNFISSLDTTFHFRDGVLVRAQEAGDSTKVPQAVIQAIGEIAPLLLAADARSKNTFEHTVPVPLLYKLVARKGEYLLMGERLSQEMKISLEPATLQ